MAEVWRVVLRASAVTPLQLDDHAEAAPCLREFREGLPDKCGRGQLDTISTKTVMQS
jgi:hypothetical protein